MIQCSQNLKGLIVVFKGGGIHAQDTTKEGLFYIISQCKPHLSRNKYHAFVLGTVFLPWNCSL